MSEVLPDVELPDTWLPHTKLTRRIDLCVTTLGKWLSWIWLALLAIIVLNVVLRYAFSEGRIELEEIQWHMYSIGFLLGLSYAYQADTHIRVDVLHERFSPALKAWVELYGILIFLIPFIALILYYGIPFVVSSYGLSEVSPSPGGLSLRWLIKGFLPLGFAILLLAVTSRLIRVWHFLFITDDQAAAKTNEGHDASQ